MEAQFKTVQFNSDKEFRTWLNSTTSHKIFLSDLGQDMQIIWIHSSGEILHCDFYASIYNGKFVDMEALEEFTPLVIDGQRMNSLVVDEIKVIN